MVSLTDRNAFAVAVVFYGLSTLYAVFLWRKGFRHHDRVTYLLLAGAFCFHTLAMLRRGFSLERCPVTNLYEATTFVAWTIVASYVVTGWWSRVRFLGAFASPVLLALGVFALFPDLDKPGPAPDGRATETRNPNTEGRKKPEGRNPKNPRAQVVRPWGDELRSAAQPQRCRPALAVRRCRSTRWRADLRSGHVPCTGYRTSRSRAWA